MSPGSSTESYPAFAHIGLRENPGKNLNQVTCPDRESNPGHLVLQPDALTVTPQDVIVPLPLPYFLLTRLSPPTYYVQLLAVLMCEFRPILPHLAVQQPITIMSLKGLETLSQIDIQIGLRVRGWDPASFGLRQDGPPVRSDSQISPRSPVVSDWNNHRIYRINRRIMGQCECKCKDRSGSIARKAKPFQDIFDRLQGPHDGRRWRNCGQ
ncbi:hypothetical protein ANN_02461 [Periplaneta americana]|uniref:Uncharacterized protein n=1 Tax=Periplaneta americana TaxID=6978 RepID=A0ABQ8TZL3_PERAM|nr:hypothetical protein ANN_02461 [Periplaneta americana]